MVYIITCILLRLVATVITYRGIKRGLMMEGNPIMNILFKRFGMIPVLTASMVLTAFTASYAAFLGSIIFKVVILGILAFDAVFDIVTEMRINEYKST